LSEELLTVGEVAQRLKVNPVTVRRWIQARELTAVLLGPHAGYRVSVADLDDFLERRKSAA
jgi:excisionase family DNA binding protein